MRNFPLWSSVQALMKNGVCNCLSLGKGGKGGKNRKGGKNCKRGRKQDQEKEKRELRFKEYLQG